MGNINDKHILKVMVILTVEGWGPMATNNKEIINLVYESDSST